MPNLLAVNHNEAIMKIWTVSQLQLHAGLTVKRFLGPLLGLSCVILVLRHGSHHSDLNLPAGKFRQKFESEFSQKVIHNQQICRSKLQDPLNGLLLGLRRRSVAARIKLPANSLQLLL
jgi:hypothetical protein